MIHLQIQKPHRSISHLPETDLPDFAVITGVNGSGKTHLLEAIEQAQCESMAFQAAGHGSVDMIGRVWLHN